MAELTAVADSQVIDADTFGNPVIQRVVSRYASTAARDSASPSPNAGETCYITGDQELQVYDGSSWVEMATAASVSNGVPIYASAAARDAAITSPDEGDVCFVELTDGEDAEEGLMWYTGSAWVAASMITSADGVMLDQDPNTDQVIAVFVNSGRRMYVGEEAITADTGVDVSIQGGSGGVLYYRSQPEAKTGDAAVWWYNSSTGKYELAREA